MDQRPLAYIVVGVVILIIVYVYYYISGSWKLVELTILDAIISLIVIMLANIGSVIIGIKLASVDCNFII